MSPSAGRAWALLGAVVLTGCGGAPQVPGATDAALPVGAAEVTAVAAPGGDVADLLPVARREVTGLLRDAAAALGSGEAAALRPLLHDPTSAFGQRWLARAEALGAVPLASYALTLDASLPELTTPAMASEGALLVAVVERHALHGVGRLGPAEDRLFLTLRQRDGRWTVADDRGAEPLGLLSADHLWDHGPVVAARRGDVLLLHHPGQQDVPALLDEAAGALAQVREAWPGAWPAQVVVLVPADAEELAALLQVSFPVDGFVAFATSSRTGTLGREQRDGARVLLNTERLLARDAATRRQVLVHELVHVATRPATGDAVPLWLEEGLAQALGEGRSTTGTELLDAGGPGTDALPPDAAFTSGTTEDTARSYQVAWSFVDWLVRTRGAAPVVRFHAAVGRGAVGTEQGAVGTQRGATPVPGTAAARVDAAARTHLGAPLDTLVARWAAR